MNWLDFTFWWIEWPLKVTVTAILVTAILLFWNNVLALVFRGTALTRTTSLREDGTYEYVPTDGMGYRHGWRGQFGQGGKFHHLFKWYGWFWFKRG
ncbi:hypothetical protein [Candidatus Poriferisocius sp.]|uniref:hypothetical protein n=1 Tax=Candidatus Poriferisocius sp. TaxID=3101276 RepID=UPI003B02C0C4